MLLTSMRALLFISVQDRAYDKQRILMCLDSVLNPNNTVVSINPTATTPASVAFSGASSTMMMSGSMTSSMSATPTSSAVQAGAAQAIQTGAIGMAALFGGAAVLLENL